MKYFIPLFFSICMTLHVNCQNFKKIDSLRKNTTNAQLHDSVKAASLNSLAKEYWSLNPDSSIIILKTAFALAEKINNKRLASGAMVYMANSYNLVSQYDSAIATYLRAYAYSKKYGYLKNAGNCYMGIGNVYNVLGNYTESVKYYTEALQLQETTHDSLNMASVLTGLGVLFEEQGNYEKALDYQTKAIKIKERKGSKTSLALSINNLGIIYFSLKKYDLSLENYNRALEMFKAANSQANIAMVYANLGNLYRTIGKKTEAINYTRNAYLIYKDLNEENEVAAQLLNLGIEYAEYGQYDQSISKMLECEKIALKLQSNLLLKNCYSSLVKTYALAGKYKDAYEYGQKKAALNDSLFNIDKVKEINELNTRYETEKKEKENQLLQTQNTLSTQTIKQQKTQSYFIITGLIVALLFGVYILRVSIQKQKANTIITNQKKEVEKQKELIEEHQKETLDSIHYAKRIQNTLLAHQDFLDAHLPENFVLFKPKDIVSGDFYWACEREDSFYLAVCDSTGHGVPGAFMSLLNIGFLSEAINEKDIFEPNLVLDHVRQRLINSVSKEGQQDGFDGILLRINRKTSKITYAAAHNSPVKVTKQAPGIEGSLLVPLKADKMPVGKGEKTEGFTLFETETKKGDVLYLFTDGYPDQFGGPKGKKFKYKQLEDLLTSIDHLPLKEQSQILNSRFEEWKGQLEQVDDVCIIGIRF